MKSFVLVGIDVSAKFLTVLVEVQGVKTAFEMGNNSGGHKKLIRIIKKGGRAVRVVLEPTGVYSLNVALALSKAKNVEVMMPNPKKIRSFANSLDKRSKTDEIDAASLLEFVRRMEFKAWEPPSEISLQLRALVRRLDVLIKDRTREKNRRHAAFHSGVIKSFVCDSIEDHREFLKKAIGDLEKQAIRLIKSCPDLQSKYELLLTVKGIGIRSAIKILGELCVLPPDMTARQWVAHCGLDPRQEQSGTSVRKPGKISRVGNKYLRTHFYMPALSAIQSEPHVRAYYEKLLSQGKLKIQGVVAVMRKLIHSVWGMLQHTTPFRGDLFYSFPPQSPLAA